MRSSATALVSMLPAVWPVPYRRRSARLVARRGQLLGGAITIGNDARLNAPQVTWISSVTGAPMTPTDWLAMNTGSGTRSSPRGSTPESLI